MITFLVWLVYLLYLLFTLNDPLAALATIVTLGESCMFCYRYRRVLDTPFPFLDSHGTWAM